MIEDLKFLIAEMFHPAEGESLERAMIEPALRPTDIILEAGCFTGGLTKWLANRVSQVFAFEPNPFVFRRLSERVKGMNVTALNIGLSDSSESRSLSMERLYDMGANLWQQGSPWKTLPVDMATIDSLQWHFDGLIIDAQGEEARILKGAWKTLDDASFVWVEIHDSISEKLGPQVADIMREKRFTLVDERKEPTHPITERLYLRR